MKTKRIQLSENFYLDEFSRSVTARKYGIPVGISPGSSEFYAVRILVGSVLQPLRTALGPVFISSGYRPPALNKKVGGSSTSQHLLALAADIVVTGYTPMQVAQWIKDNIPNFDQLILEHDRWVHISVPTTGAAARNSILTAYYEQRWWTKPKVYYLPGLLTQSEISKQFNQRKAA